MPEVNIVGEILGATDFDKPKLLCKYNFLTGNDKWAKLDGAFNGQTQLSQTDETLVLWNHPIDLHYATTTLSGWPKLVVEVWQEDEYGRNELAGYGVIYVPTSPGEHLMECVIWKPQGSLTERIFNYFLDTTSHLDHKEIVHSSKDRFDLVTESVGSIHIQLEILLRGFRNRGVELKTSTNIF
mmetsp:Transcript_17717/g.34879  ORF Transcript_17717/g.34879 Transcript_17717/m.34879 type:complete len:183 (+) Transcript_17717:123-671(+)